MTRTRTIIISFAIGAVIVTGIRFAAYDNHLGYKRGYQDAMVAIQKAVTATQYPTVKVVWPSREAISITKAGICTPIIPTLDLPEFAHIEWVSPYDRPCGPGKPGQPYADSAALAAIKAQVDATH
jgi:hypothetical protein